MAVLRVELHMWAYKSSARSSDVFIKLLWYFFLKLNPKHVLICIEEVLECMP